MFPFGVSLNHFTSRVAILCLVVAGHGTAALYLVPQAGIQSCTNGIGQPKHCSLRGGAELVADSRSKSTVVRMRNLQLIFLLAGRIELKLPHDSSVTTIVYANGLRVTDVGTIFTVEIRKDGRTDVVVAEGVVAADALQAAHSPDVKSPCRDASEAPNLALTASTPLLHHEWARTQRIGSNVGLKKGTLTNAQLDRRMSWPSGELKFAGEPLAEVVSEVNRYFQTQVTLDDSIEDLSIKGVYTTDSLDKFIHSITYMQPLEAHREGQNEIRLSHSSK